jgi:CheY-like chemotaxis protein
MKKILIVEDWAPIAKAMKVLLEDEGHQVTWLVGANSHQITDGGVILVGLTEGGKTEIIDCRQYRVAFVDGQLEGNIQGPALVELLVQSKVTCCGMSTQSEINKEMLALGATMAFKKPVILAGLLSAKLSITAVLSPSKAVLSRLTFMESRFTTPQFAALREQADACLAPFMLGVN